MFPISLSHVGFWVKLFILQFQMIIIGCNINSNFKGLSDCGYPAIPANGKINPDVEVYHAGDEVNYYCVNGFVLEGEEKNYCLGNGIWKEIFPICRKNLAFERDVKVNSTHTPEPVNSIAKAVDGKPETCNRLECCSHDRKILMFLDLKIPLRARKIYLSITTLLDDTRHGFQIPNFALMLVKDKYPIKQNQPRFACIANYKISKNEIEWKGTCELNQEEGSLLVIECHARESVQICEIQIYTMQDEYKLCGSPDRLPNTEIVHSDEYKVEYACKDPYILSRGNLTRFCQNGRWTDRAPTCEAKCITCLKTAKENITNNTQQTRGNKCDLNKKNLTLSPSIFQLIALSASIFSIILILILVAIITYYRRRISLFRRELNHKSINLKSEDILCRKLPNSLPISPSRKYVSSQIIHSNSDQAVYEEIIDPPMQDDCLMTDTDQLGYLVPSVLETSHKQQENCIRNTAEEKRFSKRSSKIAENSKPTPPPMPEYLELL